jgi:hypothetical protein
MSTNVTLEEKYEQLNTLYRETCAEEIRLRSRFLLTNDELLRASEILLKYNSNTFIQPCLQVCLTELKQRILDLRQTV